MRTVELHELAVMLATRATPTMLLAATLLFPKFRRGQPAAQRTRRHGQTVVAL
jgi:hypothetical protein